jgi:hypothetical protein
MHAETRRSAEQIAYSARSASPRENPYGHLRVVVIPGHDEYKG